MDKTFKVGLVYINTNNLGDMVVFDCAKYLIEKSLKSRGIGNYKIVPIDMGEKLAGKSKLPQSFTAKQRQKYSDADKYIQEWKSSKVYRYFLYNEKPKAMHVDLIVFAGGGLIKFHEQYFHMYIDEITAMADKNQIPVIFNAVGIEGYKDDDPRCQILKNALNRACVKAISTRDNLEMLKDKYLEPKNAKRASLVCDPALWAREAYSIKGKAKRNTVGLGVIRPEIFSLYGYDTPKQTLLQLYADIITGLENKDVDYKLFTNGGRRDHAFIEDVRVFMNRGEEFDKHVEKIPKNGQDLARIISGFSRVMACRMHAAVVAFSLNIPAVSVVWNDKQEYFANLTNQPENLIYRKDFVDIQLVIKKILNSRMPGQDQDYKNSDRDFIHAQVKKYYRRRYVVKGTRYLRSKKRKVLTKFSPSRIG